MKRGLNVIVFFSLILILSLTFVSAGFFSNFFGKITANAVSLDLTPRIAYWTGKVNQHTENGVWKTDPDRISGTNVDKLTYCKKWYPNTIAVKAHSSETISSWMTQGNTYGPYTSIKWSYECVQPICTETCSSLGYYCGIQSICGVNTNCGSCPTGYVCSLGQSCVIQKANGVSCSSDSECISGACDYDIFTYNNFVNKTNIPAVGGSSKYCHANSSKCLFYAGAMGGETVTATEADFGCVRCTAWNNNGVWDNFISTCTSDSTWINYVSCSGSTPYCNSQSVERRCDAKCVQCRVDAHCSGSTPKCVNNVCVAQTGGCTSVSQCNDNNVCTSDACSNNKCQNVLISGCCISNSQCSNSQICSNGVCVPSNSSCTDSDGGLNYFVKGSTNFVNGLGKVDCCTISSDGGPCVTQATYLQEAYCNNVSGVPSSRTYVCSNGCKDGACMQTYTCSSAKPCQPGQTCTNGVCTPCQPNSCQAGQTCTNGVCVGGCAQNGCPLIACKQAFCNASSDLCEYTFRSCQNNDGCCNPSCTSLTDNDCGGNICTDSDGGVNYFVKGETTFVNNLSKTDCCKMSPDAGPCVTEGPYLHEAYCNGNTPSGQFYTCPNGCSNGICIVSVSNCTDSDRGSNYINKGSVTVLSGGESQVFIDYCDGSAILNEYSCEGNNPKIIVYDCGIENKVCSDGQCVTCAVESNNGFCSRIGRTCGSVTALDNCGNSRTVSSCGSCSSRYACDGGVCVRSSRISTWFNNLFA